jgi:hypothetical protein
VGCIFDPYLFAVSPAYFYSGCGKPESILIESGSPCCKEGKLDPGLRRDEGFEGVAEAMFPRGMRLLNPACRAGMWLGEVMR